MNHEDPSHLDLDRIVALLESRIAPALERIASALERGEFAAPPPALRSEAVAELRKTIRERNLMRAAVLLGDFAIDHPDAPESQSLSDELAEATVGAIADRRVRLAASRSANDADAVIGIRDELVALLPPADREAVDREVLPWLMALLMRRMRAGTVRGDVAVLAEKVATSFAHRPEGASLRASLPILRRSSGLCPRCSEPFTGVEDACPKCLAEIPRIAELPESTAPPT